MAAHLNHTIVSARDSAKSAAFLTQVLGLPAPERYGPFVVVRLANGVNLDYLDATGDIVPQHYAFLVDEADFDQAFGRITEQGLRYWADPGRTRAGAINHHDGGRGVYFEDPDGHFLEIITRPYGSAARGTA
jgi:catechol 2,3-dioxygenase-like lactoylglutathione lyase family enzyme